MFDTSLVRSRTVAAPRRFALLSASIALHSAVALAVLLTSIATIEFPGNAPDQIASYRPVDPISLPPALGPGGPPKRATPVAAPVIKKQPAEQTAPAIVPETPVEPATETVASEATETGGEPAGETGPSGGGNPLGQPGGIGSDFGSGTGAPADASGPLRAIGEVKSARVLRRVEPRYPQSMIVARIRSATVTVRCIVDRNGNVRDPQILTSSFPPFNSAVLEAVSQWKFAPGTLRGTPVETYFELTVRFDLR